MSSNLQNIPFLDFSAMHASIRGEMMEAFESVYDSYWYILGKYLQRFEEEYAAFNKTKYAVGVSNGLDALILALKALEIGPGDEVIVPSNTYIATVLAVSHVGATPVFVEPDIATYNIDPHRIPEAITARTKAIMPVHLYGQACEMNTIMQIAKEHGLWIVEDNAQAHGATFKGRVTGSWGHINGTSFYPGKNLGAIGDAGAITTDDEDLARKVRLLRNYGSEVKYKNEVIGYNMRLDELQAALLSVKLRHLKHWTTQRQQIAAWYSEALAGVGDLILPACHPDATHVYHLYVVRTKYRDTLQQYLKNAGIGTLIHYPIAPHMQKAYAQLGFKKGDFPVSEELANIILSLPMWVGMNQFVVENVCEKIHIFYDGIIKSA